MFSIFKNIKYSDQYVKTSNNQSLILTLVDTKLIVLGEFFSFLHEEKGCESLHALISILL